MPETDPELSSYLDPSAVSKYEADRYSGRLGSYRWRREQHGVGEMISAVGSAQYVLDCPCGIGRWLPLLESLGVDLIVEADVSPAMLAASRARHHARWPCCYGDASSLPFPDGSFDLIFCHALTKHLSRDKQAEVLHELGRVSSKYVVCSFSVIEGFPGFLRKFRRIPDAFTVTPDWLTSEAASAGLTVKARKPCTTPIGVENSVLFVKQQADGPA